MYPLTLSSGYPFKEPLVYPLKEHPQGVVLFYDEGPIRAPFRASFHGSLRLPVRAPVGFLQGASRVLFKGSQKQISEVFYYRVESSANQFPDRTFSLSRKP